MTLLADYAEYDALGLAGLIRAGEVTAEELLETAIAAIEKLDPTLNAVVHSFFDLGVKAICQGLPDGPFKGVPLLVKNTGLALKGTPLSAGSRLFAGTVSTEDGTMAMRLKNAGLVPIGRTNTPEFALSFTTEPEAFGSTRNPWAPGHMAGGSSGGAGAAVAGGLVPLAQASDGAGSIRVPAAHCGVFGFKPSRIRNPLGPSVAEGNAGMATSHAISRSVRDSAALLDATSGPDIGDPYAVAAPLRPFLEEIRRDPGSLRIGLVTTSSLGCVIDPRCVEAANDAARLCSALGHHIEQASLDHDAASLKQAWRVIAGVNLVGQVDAGPGGRKLADAPGLMEDVNRDWLEEGRQWSGSDYLAAVGELHRTARAVGRFFERFDLLLSPVTAQVAQPLGVMAGRGQTLDGFYDQFWAHAPFTAIWNASGCPAMSVPLAWTEPMPGAPRGIPVGVQFGAAFGNDGLLFAVAGQLERARPWGTRRPLLQI